jgi:hypothetical protein
MNQNGPQHLMYVSIHSTLMCSMSDGLDQTSVLTFACPFATSVHEWAQTRCNIA